MTELYILYIYLIGAAITTVAYYIRAIRILIKTIRLRKETPSLSSSNTLIDDHSWQSAFQIKIFGEDASITVPIGFWPLTFIVYTVIILYNIFKIPAAAWTALERWHQRLIKWIALQLAGEKLKTKSIKTIATGKRPYRDVEVSEETIIVCDICDKEYKPLHKLDTTCGECKEVA